MFDEVKTLTAPDGEAMKTSAEGSLRMAKSMAVDIKTQDDYNAAAEELASIKRKRGELTDRRFSITRPLDAAKAAVMALFRPADQALEEAENALKAGMLEFTVAQERIERQRRAEAEAAAAAERARVEEEARQNAEAAAAAAEAGNAEKAAELNAMAESKREEAAIVVAAPPVSEFKQAKGVAARGTIEYEVTDFKAWVKFVAENEQYLGTLVVDSTKMRGIARAMGEGANLPGIRVFTKRSIAARAA